MDDFRPDWIFDSHEYTKLIKDRRRLIAALEEALKNTRHEKGCEQMPCDCWIKGAFEALYIAEVVKA